MNYQVFRKWNICNVWNTIISRIRQMTSVIFGIIYYIFKFAFLTCLILSLGATSLQTLFIVIIKSAWFYSLQFYINLWFTKRLQRLSKWLQSVLTRNNNKYIQFNINHFRLKLYNLLQYFLLKLFLSQLINTNWS